MSHDRNHKPGQRVISTWLYLEGIEEGGQYPQVPGNSSSPKFHDIYKRCLVTFFHSARVANPEAHLYLFCNLDFRASGRKIDQQLTEIFRKLDVEFVVTPFTFKPPTEQILWRNQFYVLNILDELLSRVNENDLCLILDSDIIWTGTSTTNELWASLEQNGSLTMLPITNEEEEINGYSLNDLNSLSKVLGNLDSSRISYAGGEFIALRGDVLKSVIVMSEEIWWGYLKILENSQIRFIEEAHFLSIVYSIVGIPFGSGDAYIRRIWTQLFHFKNRQESDIFLACWHLPAEKRFGIRRIADKFLKNPELNWPKDGSKEWVKMCSSLGVQKTSISKGARDFTKSIIDRIAEK